LNYVNFCVLNTRSSYIISLVGERETTHTRLDAEDVVVGREHVHGGGIGSLHGHRNLGVVDAGEVASTSWLVLFWLQREGIRVHTWVWATSVVVEGLHLVEVLTRLFLETVLTVEDQLEGGQWTGRFFGEVGSGTRRTNREEWGTRTLGDWHVAVGFRNRTRVGLENNIIQLVGRGEVPQGRASRGVGEAPHQFLNWVVVGQTNLLGGSGSHGVRASVLHLLDEVFVTLLREATTLFGVQVHVVGPDLENILVNIGLHVGGQVNVDADFVVLEGNQRQVQTWVTVEEEDQWQVHGLTGSRSGHLGVGRLLGFIVVQVIVQTPPLLVVLVDALATDGEFNVVDRAFRDPASIRNRRSGNSRRSVRLQFNVHVTDQITVTGNGHRHATGVGRSTVDSLFDVFHREVGVTLVHSLEESDFWVTSQVDILGAIGDELHETTGHRESFCTI